MFPMCVTCCGASGGESLYNIHYTGCQAINNKKTVLKLVPDKNWDHRRCCVIVCVVIVINPILMLILLQYMTKEIFLN